MYKIVDENKMTYSLYQYTTEAEYEKMIVSHATEIFGEKGIYFDIKKKIGKSSKGAAIPDGYYLDLMLHDDPWLYFVEVELSNLDVYGHIGEQVLRFAISSETHKHKIKTILIDEINSDKDKQKKLESFFKESKYNNVNELLDKLIFDNEVAVLIVIDEETPELNNVLSKIKIRSQVIEVQSYINGNSMLHRFSAFQDEVTDDLPTDTDYDELDTIVVPAREDGFQDVFIGENQWYQIRISAAMLDKIKYAAAYQVAPVSAITHVAKVKTIEKYKDTSKYVLYFEDGSIKKINVPLQSGGKGKAPQAPRYTTYSKLLAAKDLSDLWK